MVERLPAHVHLAIAYHPVDIPTVASNTEGWAAGLKMAVLALQAQERSLEKNAPVLVSL